jgi:hypothetical protein
MECGGRTCYDVPRAVCRVGRIQEQVMRTTVVLFVVAVCVAMDAIPAKFIKTE